MVRRMRQRLLSAFMLTGLALLPAGCVVIQNLPAPGQRFTLYEPELKREYQLYVPSSYHDHRRWPLVVTCHGTKPCDCATLQIDEWKGLAEEKGFLVAAPELDGTSCLPPKPADQVALQLGDEKAILAIVRDVSGARTVDETRVFLTGWSSGGYDVFFTGLRHPEVFRALAVRQGCFNECFVDLCVPFLDSHQPVMLMYGRVDPLKREAEQAICWLQDHDLQPRRLERAGACRRDPEPVYSFLADVVRNQQWIRVFVDDDPDDPMRVRFRVKSSFEPAKYLWDFGDNTQRSTVASPTHNYERAGLYTVKVAVYTGNDRPFVRQIQLQIPRVHLGAAPTSMAE